MSDPNKTTDPEPLEGMARSNDDLEPPTVGDLRRLRHEDQDAYREALKKHQSAGENE